MGKHAWGIAEFWNPCGRNCIPGFFTAKKNRVTDAVFHLRTRLNLQPDRAEGQYVGRV